MKNTEKKYWFKRRLYGFGWTPVCWQGWATVVLFLIIIIGGSLILPDKPAMNSFYIEIIYFAMLVVSTICIVLVSLIKGPKPKWRWGRSKDDNPNEDI